MITAYTVTTKEGYVIERGLSAEKAARIVLRDEGAEFREVPPVMEVNKRV